MGIALLDIHQDELMLLSMEDMQKVRVRGGPRLVYDGVITNR